jgi:hypothetical protein
MSVPKFPINYDKLRKALVDEVQKITHLTCIVAEPESQNWPRPPKPYFTVKMVSPAIKQGDDSAENVLDDMGASTEVWNRGGQRKLVVDFNCYAKSHEQAYDYASLWQSSLELETVQADLRRSGIAVWLATNVADLSALLNTGYEGRAHLQVEFGIASNLTEDLGSIETINVDGVTTSDQNIDNAVHMDMTAPN